MGLKSAIAAARRRTIRPFLLWRWWQLTAHQAVKYQQRDGWSHGDLLRLAHPKAPSPQHDAVFRWMLNGADSLGEREVKRKVRGEDRVAKYGAVGELPKLIDAFEQAKRASSKGEIVKLIDEFDL